MRHLPNSVPLVFASPSPAAAALPPLAGHTHRITMIAIDIIAPKGISAPQPVHVRQVQPLQLVEQQPAQSPLPQTLFPLLHVKACRARPAASVNVAFTNASSGRSCESQLRILSRRTTGTSKNCCSCMGRILINSSLLSQFLSSSSFSRVPSCQTLRFRRRNNLNSRNSPNFEPPKFNICHALSKVNKAEKDLRAEGGLSTYFWCGCSCVRC